MSHASVSEEDYALWLTHPVTMWVMAALEAKAKEQQDHWNTASWEAGSVDGVLLQELKTRADTLRAMQESSYLDMCDALQQDPVTDSR